MANYPRFRFNLKAAITQAGFKTLKEFSARMDTSPQRVSRFINGWEQPSPAMIKRMAQALEVSDDEILKLL